MDTLPEENDKEAYYSSSSRITTEVGIGKKSKNYSKGKHF